MAAKKLGRNDLCHCGSGKKFKRCHGDPAQLDRVQRAVAAARAELPKHAAREQQRIAQQGLGKPIISAELRDHRVVAVGSKVLIVKAKTFPDFLVPYVGSTFGTEWGNAELSKPEAVMHPVALWYRINALHQAKHAGKPGEVFSAPEIGASRSLLELGYNLYLLEHNAELRDRLIRRLKVRDQFFGALTEVRVAGMLARAGFDITFQDEDDRSRTHCEYDVTRSSTGKRFSVEVKTRHWGTSSPVDDERGRRQVRINVSRKLREALAKQADHDRIVFIELAMPHRSIEQKEPWWMQAAQDGIKHAEETLRKQGVEPPATIVIVSNHPYHLQLEATDSIMGLVVGGIGPTDFGKALHGSLREAVKFRKTHGDFLALWRSIEQHRNVPMTFDGSNPHLAFGEHPPPFQIGARYEVPGPDGALQVAMLEDAIAFPSKRCVHGVYKADSGQLFMGSTPMTEAEVRAYETHPDTFFGVVKPTRGANGPLEMYDFFFETYGGKSKEDLLKAFAAARSRDIEALRELSREELATIYCERMTLAMMAQANARPKR